MTRSPALAVLLALAVFSGTLAPVFMAAGVDGPTATAAAATGAPDVYEADYEDVTSDPPEGWDEGTNVTSLSNSAPGDRGIVAKEETNILTTPDSISFNNWRFEGIVRGEYGGQIVMREGVVNGILGDMGVFLRPSDNVMYIVKNGSNYESVTIPDEDYFRLTMVSNYSGFYVTAESLIDGSTYSVSNTSRWKDFDSLSGLYIGDTDNTGGSIVQIRIDKMSLYPANASEVSGTVNKSGGGALEGATVDVETSGGSSVTSLTTNASGEYSTYLYDGEYSLTASADGYQSATESVTLPPSATVDFSLSETSDPTDTRTIEVVDETGGRWSADATNVRVLESEGGETWTFVGQKDTNWQNRASFDAFRAGYFYQITIVNTDTSETVTTTLPYLPFAWEEPLPITISLGSDGEATATATTTGDGSTYDPINGDPLDPAEPPDDATPFPSDPPETEPIGGTSPLGNSSVDVRYWDSEYRTVSLTYEIRWESNGTVVYSDSVEFDDPRGLFVDSVSTALLPSDDPGAFEVQVNATTENGTEWGGLEPVENESDVDGGGIVAGGGGGGNGALGGLAGPALAVAVGAGAVLAARRFGGGGGPGSPPSVGGGR